MIWRFPYCCDHLELGRTGLGHVFFITLSLAVLERKTDIRMKESFFAEAIYIFETIKPASSDRRKYKKAEHTDRFFIVSVLCE